MALLPSTLGLTSSVQYTAHVPQPNEAVTFPNLRRREEVNGWLGTRHVLRLDFDLLVRPTKGNCKVRDSRRSLSVAWGFDDGVEEEEESCHMLMEEMKWVLRSRKVKVYYIGKGSKLVEVGKGLTIRKVDIGEDAAAVELVR